MKFYVEIPTEQLTEQILEREDDIEQPIDEYYYVTLVSSSLGAFYLDADVEVIGE